MLPKAKHVAQNPPLNEEAEHWIDAHFRDRMRAHSATKFGDQQLFSEMTLGTFPSMAPYQKSCWRSLYFNCRQVKLDPQKPLFFIAFWV